MTESTHIARLLPTNSIVLFVRYMEANHQLIGAQALMRVLPIDRPSAYDRLIDAKIAAMQKEADKRRAEWQASLADTARSTTASITL